MVVTETSGIAFPALPLFLKFFLNKATKTRDLKEDQTWHTGGADRLVKLAGQCGDRDQGAGMGQVRGSPHTGSGSLDVILGVVLASVGSRIMPLPH